MDKEAQIYFENFVSKYNLKENKEDVNSYFYKYQHTYDVLRWMDLITSKMQLNEKQLEQARTVAIFHDLGRFVQLEKTKRYDDLKTGFDHAQESVFILSNQNWFSKVNVSEKNNISFACFYHNKISIPKENSFKYQLGLLLRDADKLAILERMPLNNCSQNLTTRTKEAFLKKELIDCHFVKTDIDEIIFHLAYIFDINYPETLKLLQKFRLLDRWINFLENNLQNEDFQQIKNCIYSFLKIPK